MTDSARALRALRAADAAGLPVTAGLRARLQGLAGRRVSERDRQAVGRLERRVRDAAARRARPQQAQHQRRRDAGNGVGSREVVDLTGYDNDDLSRQRRRRRELVDLTRDEDGRGGARHVPSRRRRRVHWANDAGGLLVAQVLQVPRGALGGRGMEPGYVDRTKRRRALRDVHGIALDPLAVNLRYGTNGEGGSRGTYTADMALRDTWHARRRGGSWYVRTRARGRDVFTSRYDPATDRALRAIMDGTARRRN